MKLSQLVADLPLVAPFDAAAGDPEITAVAYDSRVVASGTLFVCVPGFAVDGHEYAPAAVEAGAVALIVEHPVADCAVPQVVVDSSRRALAHVGAAFYGHPSEKLSVIGITGTNGKTTTTYLIDAIMRAAGRTTGIIGTVETRIGDTRLDAARTTPESLDLQRLLAQMVDAGVETVAIEVSSHAIDLDRIAATRFAVVAFTNLTQDHLDYHHTMENYYQVKKRLFTDFPADARVIAVDTEAGVRLADEVAAEHLVLRVGRDEHADVYAAHVRPLSDGTAFTLVTPAGEQPVDLPLSGVYNVENAVVAAGCALACGIDATTVAAALDDAPQVPGRLERILCGQPFEVVVDYSHTPDSLQKAIGALRDVCSGDVIVVFGCGGDRDPEKRPIMGRVAGRYADLAIATSDNPRTEDAVAILIQVEDGLRQSEGTYAVEVDRRRAIERACRLAKPGDCVLIAGKGHEDYQIFAHHTIHFDDREVARESLALLGYDLQGGAR